MNKGKHFLECVVPTPSVEVVLTCDNRIDFMRDPTAVTTLFYNVQYGARFVTELVVAGSEGEVFRPYTIYLWQRQDQSL